MRHLLYIIVVMLLTSVESWAQETLTWEQAWQEAVSAEDMDDETWDENYEYLSQLANNKLDINTSSREELEQLPFLSAQQVMDILEYRNRYGGMRSLGELRMVPSLDYFQLLMLPFFVTVYEHDEQERTTAATPPLHSSLTATARLPLYDRQGDRQGYLGYKYRHSLRFELTRGEQLRAGIIGAQDAGEPFFSGKNKWGYDAYSYYLQIGKKGILDKAIIGKYKMSAGMGLVLNTSFSLGKLSTLQALGRQVTTLRPHSSRTEADYFQGAAVTLAMGQGTGATSGNYRPMKVTVFASYRPIDGTLNADNILTNITTTGYHRTKNEMERKHNTHMTAMGGRVAYTNGGWRAGINGVYTHLDRRLCPPSTVLYRRYYPQGSDFTNASLDYGYTHHRFAVSGETAINGDGALATANTMSYQPSASLGIVALWRFYSYRYTGLYSHSFGNNSSAQNESGFFLGARWNPLPHLSLQAYGDYAYFPWARYLISLPSHAYDFLIQAEYKRRQWMLTARGRVQLRQRDDEAKTALTDNNDYRGRLALTFFPATSLSLKTQIDATRAFYLEASHGWMVSEQIIWKSKAWFVSGIAAFFDTDDYASRLYLYESQMAHEYSLASYYGEGIRLMLMARASLTRALTFTTRIGYTNYFDRPTIGTALQLIDHSYQTDIDFQLIWRL